MPAPRHALNPEDRDPKAKGDPKPMESKAPPAPAPGKPINPADEQDPDPLPLQPIPGSVQDTGGGDPKPMRLQKTDPPPERTDNAAPPSDGVPAAPPAKPATRQVKATAQTGDAQPAKDAEPAAEQKQPDAPQGKPDQPAQPTQAADAPAEKPAPPPAGVQPVVVSKAQAMKLEANARADKRKNRPADLGPTQGLPITDAPASTGTGAGDVPVLLIQILDELRQMNEKLDRMGA